MANKNDSINEKGEKRTLNRWEALKLLEEYENLRQEGDTALRQGTWHLTKGTRHDRPVWRSDLIATTRIANNGETIEASDQKDPLSFGGVSNPSLRQAQNEYRQALENYVKVAQLLSSVGKFQS